MGRILLITLDFSRVIQEGITYTLPKVSVLLYLLQLCYFYG